MKHLLSILLLLPVTLFAQRTTQSQLNELESQKLNKTDTLNFIRKQPGKGLSTFDFTGAMMNKLNAIAPNATNVDSTVLLRKSAYNGDKPSFLAKLDSAKANARRATDLALVDLKPTYVSDIASLTALVRGNIKSVIVQDFYRGGQFRYNPNLTSFDYGVTFPASNGVTTVGGWERAFLGVASPLWWGATPDFNTTTNTGTENSGFIQSAVNYINSKGGGIVDMIIGNFLCNGTVYVNPTNGSTPIHFRGIQINDRILDPVYTGTVLFKTTNTNPDFIRVNMNSSGIGIIINDSYNSFGVTGIAFAGRNVVTGITAIKAFRTRGDYSALSANKIDYLIQQPVFDAAGNQNYCDGSTYTNLTITQNRFGGLMLSYADNSKIEHIVHEFPTSTAKFLVELNYATTTSIHRIISAQTSSATVIADGALIKMVGGSANHVSGLHVERNKYESIVYAVSERSLRVSGLHERFESNYSFRLNNVNGLRISDWNAWSNKNSGYSDIFFSGASTDVSIENTRIDRFNTSNPGENPRVARTLTVTGDSASVANLNTSSGRVYDGTKNTFRNIPISAVTGASTDAVPEGVLNYYATNSRTLSYSLTGFSAGTNTAITSTDNLLSAFQKVQGQLNDRVSQSTPSNNPSWLASLNLSRITAGYNLATDADFSVPFFGAVVTLPTITANRTITLLNPATLGKINFIVNRNTSAFNWNVSGTLTDIDGSIVTTLAKNTAYQIVSDGGTEWKIIGKAQVATLSTVLTGFVSGTNTAITSTDNLLSAFQKVQGQLNDRVSQSTPSNNPSWLASLNLSRITAGYELATDTDYSVPFAGIAVTLPTVTANRTVTLLTPSGGKLCMLVNRNTSAFNWNVSGTLVDVDGQTLTTLASNTTYLIIAETSIWRVIAKTGYTNASTTYTPGTINSGTQISTTITVTGARMGQFPRVSFTNSLSGCRIWPEITSANTVTVYFRNDTGGSVTLSAGNINVKVD